MQYTQANLEDAIYLATVAHSGQTDKNGAPYILHPLRVGLYFGEISYQIAGVLHDTVEDAHVTLATVKASFGEEIMEAIDALTHRKGERNIDYWHRIAENDIAYAVKFSDIKDNKDRLYLIEDDETHDRLKKKYIEAKKVIMEHRNFVEWDEIRLDRKL